MGADTRIEWADHTFNPWTGCTKVSPACDHCYAEAQAKRAPKTFGGWGPHAERKRTSESYWRQPLLWNKRAAKEGSRPRVFCASMADIMDKAAPIEWFVDALDMMRVTPHLIWLLLTKRPQLIRRRLEEALAHLSKGTDRGDLIEWIAAWLHGRSPENIWLGTTAENQAEADRRIPHLLAAPAAKRFLSCEPLLGPVDLTALPDLRASTTPCNALSDRLGSTLCGTRIDWIIAGGESGSHARASHPGWFRSLRDQCQAAGVPFFFKQWGEWAPADPKDPSTPFPNGWRCWAGHPHVAAGPELLPEAGAEFVARLGKKAAGATLDGREWREVPDA